MTPLLVPLALFASAPVIPPSPVVYETGAEVIEAMYSRYAETWYHTLTFVQKTTFPNGQVQTWYEAMELPGKLRIDIAPLENRNSLIFRNDTVYRVTNGEVANTLPRIHPLLLLGFDIYAQPVERSIEKLTTLGFDLSKTHRTTWQGRPTIVVGAAEGDSTSHQFWVDEERLVFVRLLEPLPNDRGMADTRFNKYEKLGGGWISPEVIFFQGGRQTLTEEYAEMKVGMTFDSTLFVPSPLSAPGWVTP